MAYKKKGKIKFSFVMSILTAIVVFGTLIICALKRFFGIDIKRKVNDSFVNISDEKIKAIANQQEGAMKGLGTREDELLKGLEGLNTEELKMVYNAYGRRSDWANPMSFLSPKDLIQTYRSELSGDDLAKMKSIWADTGLF